VCKNLVVHEVVYRSERHAAGGVEGHELVEANVGQGLHLDHEDVVSSIIEVDHEAVDKRLGRKVRLCGIIADGIKHHVGVEQQPRARDGGRGVGERGEDLVGEHARAHDAPQAVLGSVKSVRRGHGDGGKAGVEELLVRDDLGKERKGRLGVAHIECVNLAIGEDGEEATGRANHELGERQVHHVEGGG